MIGLRSDKKRSQGNDIVVSRYVLPVEPNVQKLVHVFYTQPSFIAPYAKVERLPPI